VPAPFNTTVSAVPVRVMTPSPSGTSTLVITNNGPSVVYLGGATVTSVNGFPLPVGQQLDVARVAWNIYACSPVTATATATTTTAAASSGATTLAVTSGTGIANGAYIQVGAGNAAEITTVTSGGGTASLTVPALAYDHASGAAVTVVTPQLTSVSTANGAV
jgi:hypothetical protein